ncbi:GNAT family N-acetyltransferase [Afifella aestuarii]|uniref:GNAT family N-acetyltransferase n=1 Tax=Afifella aestuarii TaxID=1909496 RepID=UPI00319E5312
MFALDEGRPVGFVSVWEPGNFIHHLHVDPRETGRGIGRALLSALPGWEVARYRLKCVSANAEALAFYRARGFIEVGEGSSDGQGYLILESSVSFAILSAVAGK